MDGHAQQRNRDAIEHDTATIPATVDEIDAKIAFEHGKMDEAIESCQEGVVEWYVLDIERLTNLRRIVATGSPTLDALLRMRLRRLSKDYARAMCANDLATADRLKAEIERLERGQL